MTKRYTLWLRLSRQTDGKIKQQVEAILSNEIFKWFYIYCLQIKSFMKPLNYNSRVILCNSLTTV